MVTDVRVRIFWVGGKFHFRNNSHIFMSECLNPTSRFSGSAGSIFTTMKADVIIIGGGLAGIVTALELLEQNMQVVLFDRSTEARFGGLALWSMGGIFYVDSPFQRKAGIKDSEALALKDWHSYAEFEESDLWPKKWAEQYVSRCTTEVYEWMKPMGIKYIPSVQWIERGYKVGGNSVPRFHPVWGTGEVLTHTLINRLKKHPNCAQLQLHFRHKVTGLLTRDGRINGVKGIDEVSGKGFECNADAVIIAAGGMTGDPEYVKQHWNEDHQNVPAHLLSGSHLVANGQIYKVAKEVDAEITHLDKQWNYAAGVHHPDADHPQHGLSIIPPKTALWVNYQGKRIGSHPLISGYDTRFLVDEICKQDKQYSWQILNRKIALKELGVSGSLYNDANRQQRKLAFIKSVLFGNRGLYDTLVNRCKDVLTAHSVEELANKMNALAGTKDVDASLLKKEIEAFDQQIRLGPGKSTDEQIRLLAKLRTYRGDKIRTVNFKPVLDPGSYPLIAIREFILTRKSLGGIQTNLNCQVLRPDGSIIDGLYAVGEAAGFGGGGIHGKRALEGTFLGNCILHGRIAAKKVAD